MAECECDYCPDCDGSGQVFFSFSGEYLGTRRCDDLDTMESCDECGGSGVVFECYKCQEERAEDNDQ